VAEYGVDGYREWVALVSVGAGLRGAFGWGVGG
jgi:hypothetical protein